MGLVKRQRFQQGDGHYVFLITILNVLCIQYGYCAPFRIYFK